MHWEKSLYFTPFQVKSSQISFIAWKIRKIGEASADTAATETYYMKGYYNLEVMFVTWSHAICQTTGYCMLYALR